MLRITCYHPLCHTKPIGPMVTMAPGTVLRDTHTGSGAMWPQCPALPPPIFISPQPS